MRFIHVISDTNRRGAQVFATYLAEALGRRGHEEDLCALVGSADPSPLPVTVLGPNRFDPRGLWRLRRALAAADVGIAHGSSTLPACVVAGVGIRTPIVYRQISDPTAWANTPLRRLRVSRALRRAAVVVALSEHNRQQLADHHGMSPERVRVVPNGAPASLFGCFGPHRRATARRELGLPNRPTVLFVGALSPEKAPELAIQAVASLEGVQLVLLGGGPLEGDLRREAEHVAPRRVEIRPPTDDLRPWYAAADVLVLPSRTEAVPGVLIEAGMSCLPCVASSVGAVSEVVVDEETGLLVDPGDAHSIGTAIGRLLEDPTLAQRLGSEARARCVKRFEINDVAAAWERVLVETAGEGSAPAR